MRFGVYGPRATKLHITDTIMLAISWVIGWILLEYTQWGKITLLLVLAIFVFSLYLPFSRLSNGPRGKEFKKALAEDKTEDVRQLTSKQPWE